MLRDQDSAEDSDFDVDTFII